MRLTSWPITENDCRQLDGTERILIVANCSSARRLLCYATLRLPKLRYRDCSLLWSLLFIAKEQRSVFGLLSGRVTVEPLMLPSRSRPGFKPEANPLGPGEYLDFERYKLMGITLRPMTRFFLIHFMILFAEGFPRTGCSLRGSDLRLRLTPQRDAPATAYRHRAWPQLIRPGADLCVSLKDFLLPLIRRTEPVQLSPLTSRGTVCLKLRAGLSLRRPRMA